MPEENVIDEIDLYHGITGLLNRVNRSSESKRGDSDQSSLRGSKIDIHNLVDDPIIMPNSQESRDEKSLTAQLNSMLNVTDELSVPDKGLKVVDEDNESSDISVQTRNIDAII